MGRYTGDGGVVSSKIQIGEKRVQEHRTLFGLFRGIVIRSVYPDDPNNANGERMEYVVKVRGQEYPNATNMRVGGGIYNYNERVRKGVEKSDDGQVTKGTIDENLDGEYVYVLFLEGHGDVPIIIGSGQHPRQGKYKKYKQKDGSFDVSEFNGVEFSVDKDSNYTIRQVGRKKPDGSIENSPAVGALIRLGGVLGDILMKSAKGALVSMSGDGSVQVISKDSSMLSLNAADGSVILVSKDGQVLTMNSAGINIVDKTGASVFNINSDGVQVTGGKVVVKSQDCSINSGTVSIGDGASFHAVIYEMLKTIFDAHTHATVMGPSGPPLATMALAELSPTTSAQANLIKVKGNT